MPNMAVTTLGVVWIGFLGVVRRSDPARHVVTSAAAQRRSGTDTLFLVALGVVANDIGALMVGSAVGKTPLRAWISPNKTSKGCSAARCHVVAMLLFGIASKSSTPGTHCRDLLILGLVISVAGPARRPHRVDVQAQPRHQGLRHDRAGHGGVLDRFDGFLFVLPGVYYLTLVLPWLE